MESRYATVSLTPSTSRNCSDSAPGTTPDLHVPPPSVVTAKVPPRPLAHTTRLFTGLTAIRLCVVPLACGVSVGEWPAAWLVAELCVAPTRAMAAAVQRPVSRSAEERPNMESPLEAALWPRGVMSLYPHVAAAPAWWMHQLWVGDDDSAAGRSSSDIARTQPSTAARTDG